MDPCYTYIELDRRHWCYYHSLLVSLFFHLQKWSREGTKTRQDLLLLMKVECPVGSICLLQSWKSDRCGWIPSSKELPFWLSNTQERKDSYSYYIRYTTAQAFACGSWSVPVKVICGLNASVLTFSSHRTCRFYLLGRSEVVVKQLFLKSERKQRSWSQKEKKYLLNLWINL